MSWKNEIVRLTHRELKIPGYRNANPVNRAERGTEG